MDAQDKSTCFTVCLHKTQIPSASKNTSFPWSIWVGVCSSGFTGLVCESITKTAFQRVWRTIRYFPFPDFNKTDSNIESPADTCGCGIPEGLKMSLVFSPPLIRAWWKQQCISLLMFTQDNTKSVEANGEEVNWEKRNRLKQRQRRGLD